MWQLQLRSCAAVHVRARAQLSSAQTPIIQDSVKVRGGGFSKIVGIWHEYNLFDVDIDIDIDIHIE